MPACSRCRRGGAPSAPCCAAATPAHAASIVCECSQQNGHPSRGRCCTPHRCAVGHLEAFLQARQGPARPALSPLRVLRHRWRIEHMVCSQGTAGTAPTGTPYWLPQSQQRSRSDGRRSCTPTHGCGPLHRMQRQCCVQTSTQLQLHVSRAPRQPVPTQALRHWHAPER